MTTNGTAKCEEHGNTTADAGCGEVTSCCNEKTGCESHCFNDCTCVHAKDACCEVCGL